MEKTIIDIRGEIYDKIDHIIDGYEWEPNSKVRNMDIHFAIKEELSMTDWIVFMEKKIHDIKENIYNMQGEIAKQNMEMVASMAIASLECNDINKFYNKPSNFGKTMKLH